MNYLKCRKHFSFTFCDETFIQFRNWNTLWIARAICPADWVEKYEIYLNVLHPLSHEFIHNPRVISKSVVGEEREKHASNADLPQAAIVAGLPAKRILGDVSVTQNNLPISDHLVKSDVSRVSKSEISSGVFLHQIPILIFL